MNKDRIQFEIRMMENNIKRCGANIASARKNLTNTVTNGSDLDIATFAKPYVETIEKNINDLKHYTDIREMLESMLTDAE